MTSLEDTLGADDYDEFSLLHENAEEWGLPTDHLPPVGRLVFELASGHSLSYLKWRNVEPELVFLPGGVQNAHTWDTLILALGRPALAVDLPGHGHSDRRADRNYGPWENANAVAELIEQVAGLARAVIGMSLGGATTTRLAAVRPDVCTRLFDGRWTWRYDLFGPSPSAGVHEWVDFTPLWEDVSAIEAPTLFVGGAASPFVRDEDVTEMQCRLPAISVGGGRRGWASDRPLELTQLIRSFVL